MKNRPSFTEKLNYILTNPIDLNVSLKTSNEADNIIKSLTYLGVLTGCILETNTIKNC